MSTKPAERLVFQQLVEGLFKAIDSKLTPRIVERIGELGIRRDRMLPAYPQEKFNQALDIVTEELFPGLPRAEAQEQMGRQLIRGLQETMLGKAQFALVRLIGPKRALDKMVSTIKTGANYIEARLDWSGPTSAILWLSDADSPEVNQGTFSEMLMAAGAKNARLTRRDHDKPGLTFDVRWDA